MRRAFHIALALAIGYATRGAAQASDRDPRTVRVIAPDSARSAALLREVLAGPRDLRLVDSTHAMTVPMGVHLDRPLIVVGAPLTLGGTVRGDVIVVGGDLFIHPGALVQGRAVAIGGGVYPSLLATVSGGTMAFRDETYDLLVEGATVTLRWRELGVSREVAEFPVLGGLRIPSYDRVDGLSLPWGPVLRPTRGMELEPLLTYRSDLGDVDPSAELHWRIGASDTLRIFGGRETATNDRWIRSDLLNSALAIWSGDDERNYYRRDVASARLSRAWSRGSLAMRAELGALAERAWSVGPDSLDDSAPWSVYHRRNREEGILRPNPPVTKGTLTSALLGAGLAWRLEDVTLRLDVSAEMPFTVPGDARFAQVTTSFFVAFPTFGAQRFTTTAHSVVTGPDVAPRQRWSYLGGPATIPTVEPTFAFGGDQLLFIESDYDYPLQRFQLPLVGGPVVSLVSIIGGAGAHRLPALTQNVGVRVALGPARLTGVIDPKSRHRVVSFGLSLLP